MTMMLWLVDHWWMWMIFHFCLSGYEFTMVNPRKIVKDMQAEGLDMTEEKNKKIYDQRVLDRLSRMSYQDKQIMLSVRLAKTIFWYLFVVTFLGHVFMMTLGQ
jgi:hypothetical protein